MSELSHAALTTADARTILRDKTVRGLHTRGHRFFLYFRTKGGIERRPKLGEFPVMTVAQARSIARDMLLEVAKGNDPIAKRIADRAAPSVDEALKRFEDEHLTSRKAGDHTAKVIRRALPAKFLARQVASIDHEDMCQLHREMRGAPVSANRTIAHLSSFFGKCERWTYRPKGSNPCEGVERFPERNRKRYMAADEAERIATVLNAYRDRFPAAVAFVELLIFTGARSGEIAAARWDWIDGGVLKLPDSKTGAKTVFLPPQAMAILDALPRTHATLTGIASPRKLWDLVRVEAKCPDLRLHDLRHSFASAALDAGFSLDQIGELLGHASTQTTKRYAHLVDATAQTAAAKTAALVAANMKGK